MTEKLFISPQTEQELRDRYGAGNGREIISGNNSIIGEESSRRVFIRGALIGGVLGVFGAVLTSDTPKNLELSPHTPLPEPNRIELPRNRIQQV